MASFIASSFFAQQATCLSSDMRTYVSRFRNDSDDKLGTAARRGFGMSRFRQLRVEKRKYRSKDAGHDTAPWMQRVQLQGAVVDV